MMFYALPYPTNHSTKSAPRTHHEPTPAPGPRRRYAVQASLEGADRDRTIIPGVTGEQGALFDNAPGVEDSLAWCVAQARLEELTT